MAQHNAQLAVPSVEQIDAFYDEILNLSTRDLSPFYFDDGDQGAYVVGASLEDDELKIVAGTEEGEEFGSNQEFHMYRNWEKGRAVVSFEVCNDVEGQRHPVIRPSRLFARGVQHFEESGGVDAIAGEWRTPPRPSVNYEQYAKTLQELTGGRRPTPEDRKIAALSTWTGGCAIKAGFSEVESVTVDKRSSVIPYFVRPEN